MQAKAIFKMIRIPNLLMMALTMFSSRYFLIIPILKFSGSNSQISNFNFFLVVCSVLFIAAGGYLINDYYDADIDEINKPEKVVINREISAAKVYLLFHLFSFTGILISFYLGFFSKMQFIGFIHTGCAILLWIYARYLKRMFLVGNIVVSLLCGYTIVLNAIYDQPARNAEPILILIGGYAVFAFFISMVREMIKDLEDMKGDIACGCKTLPVVAGPKVSIIISSIVILLSFSLLAYVQFLQYQSNDFVSFAYIGLAIQIPLVYLFYRLLKSKKVSDFKLCSILCKLIMLTGILSMSVFYLGFR